MKLFKIIGLFLLINLTLQVFGSSLSSALPGPRAFTELAERIACDPDLPVSLTREELARIIRTGVYNRCYAVAYVDPETTTTGRRLILTDTTRLQALRGFESASLLRSGSVLKYLSSDTVILPSSDGSDRTRLDDLLLAAHAIENESSNAVGGLSDIRIRSGFDITTPSLAGGSSALFQHSVTVSNPLSLKVYVRAYKVLSQDEAEITRFILVRFVMRQTERNKALYEELMRDNWDKITKAVQLFQEFGLRAE